MNYRVAALIVLVLAAVPAGAAQEEAGATAERYRANAVSLGGLMVGGRSAPSGSTRVDFVVERMSTDEERAALLEALRSGGSAKLHVALARTKPVGRVILEGRLGDDLRYAREHVGEDGQRVLILASDRQLQFREIRRHSRSRAFDITVIELVLDQEGQGSGTAMPAVRVEYDEESGDIALKNLNTSPVQLLNVRRTK